MLPPLHKLIARFTDRRLHIPVTDLAAAYLSMDQLHIRDFKKPENGLQLQGLK
jgi:hypothetical protein